MNKSYHNMHNSKTLQRLNAIKFDLPPFFDEFFIGIQSRTSPLTRLNYAYDLRIFCHFLTTHIVIDKIPKQLTIDDIESLSAFDIERFLDYINSYTYNGKQLQCGDKAKERKLAAVRALIKYFFKKEKLTKDISVKIESIKTKVKPIIRLEIDEVSKLLNIVEHGTNQVSQKQEQYMTLTRERDLAIFVLFLGTGVRVSELVGIDTLDINLSDNSFSVVRKGGNRSILYFSDEVHQALAVYNRWRTAKTKDGTPQGNKINQTTAYFVSVQGQRLTVRAVQNIIKKYAKIVSPLKNISPHKLRSTYGTNLYRETQDIFVVAEVLGHKDVNTTKKHYAAISEDIKRNAASKVQLRDND